jgi:regulator of sirC expression with transglutaminase-like and TPR domain
MRPREQIEPDADRRVGQRPKTSSMRAAISLLTDSDPKVVSTCRAQILEWGRAVRPLLVETSRRGEARLRAQARGMLRTMELLDWGEQVREYAASLPSEDVLPLQQFEEGVVLLSGMGRQDKSRATTIRKALDVFADDLRPRVAEKSALTSARLLAAYLRHDLGFDGSHSSFYELSSVHFDQVLEGRRGVPVTLALLYLLVGRRAGLAIAGMAIPDHFLVRVHGVRPVLLDPYHEGRQVTKADCIRYLRVAGYGLHTSSYLHDVSDRQILDCLLRNLLRVYGYREDHEICSAIETARRHLMQG